MRRGKRHANTSVSVVLLPGGTVVCAAAAPEPALAATPPGKRGRESESETDRDR